RCKRIGRAEWPGVLDTGLGERVQFSECRSSFPSAHCRSNFRSGSWIGSCGPSENLAVVDAAYWLHAFANDLVEGSKRLRSLPSARGLVGKMRAVVCQMTGRIRG